MMKLTIAALVLLGASSLRALELYGISAADIRALDRAVPASVLEPVTLDVAQQNSGNVPRGAEKLWEAMRWEHPSALQPGCEPARYSPPAGVKYRGLAILLHGFSACPQQYEQLGPQLAQAGFEVFVPLFPGHGAMPLQLSPRLDNVDFVPRSPAGWGAELTQINQLAALFMGQKVLVGLSQGANMALRAAQTEPDLYDKVVAISPKLRNETSMFSGLFSNSIHILNIDEYILGMRSGWKSCEEVDSLPPVNRAGFCNMENRHAIAMLDFGKIVIDGAAVKTRATVQMILSHDDDGTCNRADGEVLNSMHGAGSTAKACIMPEGVPHAMFPLQDSPYEKPWVPPLFRAVENFLTRGTFVPGSADTVTDCALSW